MTGWCGFRRRIIFGAATLRRPSKSRELPRKKEIPELWDPVSVESYERILFTMIIKSLQLSIVTILVSAVASWAGSATGPARIQGVVKDSKGQPVAGAEVHIKSKDGSGLEKIARTDSAGNYGVSGLPVTDYELVLFVNKQIKATLTNQHVFGNKPTQADFKL